MLPKEKEEVVGVEAEGPKEKGDDDDAWVDPKEEPKPEPKEKLDAGADVAVVALVEPKEKPVLGVDEEPKENPPLAGAAVDEEPKDEKPELAGALAGVEPKEKPDDDVGVEAELPKPKPEEPNR